MHFSGSGYTGLQGVVEFSTGSGSSVVLLLLEVIREAVLLVTRLKSGAGDGGVSRDSFILRGRRIVTKLGPKKG